MKEKYLDFLDTPIGKLGIVQSEDYIVKIFFSTENIVFKDYVLKCMEETVLAKKQLCEYFMGKRKEFSFRYKQEGTSFRKKVWEELVKIPYGQTRSYKDIAISMGNPLVCRAVGQANNKNQLPIVIPCHRVIGSDKSFVGYAGGLEVKKFLLNLEEGNI